MYNNNIIHLHAFHEEREMFYPSMLEGQFEFNRNGKFQWLQKICFWILTKLKAQKQDTTVKVTRHEINLDSLFDAIFENQKMIYMLYNREAKYIIMGMDCFQKFMRTEEAMNSRMMMFNVPDDYRSRAVIQGVRCEAIFRGIKVIFVPYIDGMFCLPEINNF